MRGGYATGRNSTPTTGPRDVLSRSSPQPVATGSILLYATNDLNCLKWCLPLASPSSERELAGPQARLLCPGERPPVLARGSWTLLPGLSHAPPIRRTGRAEPALLPCIPGRLTLLLSSLFLQPASNEDEYRKLASDKSRSHAVDWVKMMNTPLDKLDPEMHNIIELEKSRQVRPPARRHAARVLGNSNSPAFFFPSHPQLQGLELIPSENFTSLSVMQAVGSVMTNKYSEGYPGARYYGGNEYIDMVRTLGHSAARHCRLGWAGNEAS